MNTYEIYIRYGFIENNEITDEEDFITTVSASCESAAVSVAKTQIRETHPYEISKITIRKI